MSWKPSRSSGVCYDRYSRKSDANRSEVVRMIETHEYLHFDNMNKFSKHIYLYWLNENKKHYDLVGKRFNHEYAFYEFEACCMFTSIYNMLLKYKDLLYKPLQKLLK